MFGKTAGWNKNYFLFISQEISSEFLAGSLVEVETCYRQFDGEQRANAVIRARYRLANILGISVEIPI